MKSIALLYLIFFSISVFAQDNCDFNPQYKKGGLYLFSTFFEDPYLHKVREGVCQTLHLGKVYERRGFVKGRLTEETINTFEGKPRVRSQFSLWDGDSILVVQDVWRESGEKESHSVYYLDRSGRRCMTETQYGTGGKQRFERSLAWIRYNELNESDKSMHPPHTVDEDGYTYLCVPFGTEKIYDPFSGALTQVRTHQLIKNGYYENRSLHGPTTEYYENGKVKAKGTYKNGALDGLFEKFYPDGKKLSSGAYQNGIEIGTWQAWHPNGKPSSVYVYDLESAHPFSPSKKEWAENGQLTLEQVLDESGSGYLKEWTPTGILIHDVNIYLLDQHTGVETWWYPNGQLHWRRDYRKGQDTTMVQFYKNGDPERLEVFKEDHAGSAREVRRWYEGKIQQSVFLTQTRPDGYQMQSQEDFYPSGIRKSYILYKNQECFKELYAANGTKILYRYTILDSLEGPYQRFDTTGVLLLDFRYHKGLRNGWCREYDATGKLQFAQLYNQGNPVKDSENLARKHHFQALTSDEKRGLQYLFSAQLYDSTVFDPEHLMQCLELLYREYPSVLGTLPVNWQRSELDFYHSTRLQFQIYGPCTAIHVNTHPFGAKSFLIYPDMEIEPLQHLFTNEDLQTQQHQYHKFDHWHD